MAIRYSKAKMVWTGNSGEMLQMVEIFCNSTDTKPTEGLTNGSTCVEVDTGKLFLFDEKDGDWVEVQ